MVYYLKKPSLKWESPYNKEEMGQDNISGQKYTFFYTQDFVSCSKFYATIGWFIFPFSLPSETIGNHGVSSPCKKKKPGICLWRDR